MVMSSVPVGSLQDIHKLGSFSGKAVSELESIPLCLFTMLFFLSFACMQKALLAGNFYNYNSSCSVYECLSRKAKLYDATAEYFQ